MRILDVVERQPLTIPISEVMCTDGTFDFVPEVRQKGYFDIDYRGNALVVIAGNYVGQLPLTKELAIHVKPKIPLSNLTRIIGVANQPIRCLDFFRRRYLLEGQTSDSLQEAMARSLVACLKTVNAEGIYREYVERHEVIAAPRGRIDVNRFIKWSLPRARPTSLSCRFHELSVDTLFNRVIKRTITDVGETLAGIKSVDELLIRQLSYFADMFESVPLDNSITLVEKTQDLLSRRHIPDLRHYYLDVLDTCLIVLGGSGVEMIDSGGSSGMHSLIVNLEDTFELYTRSVLQQGFLEKKSGLLALNGNVEGKGCLFADNDKYAAKPDLVIKGDNKNLALGDVKYKTKLGESDRYQLIAHSLAYDVSCAFFVTPANDDENSGGIRLGRIGVSNSIELSQYRFNLNASDLLKEERDFCAWVTGLAKS